MENFTPKMLQGLALVGFGLFLGLGTVELIARGYYTQPWYEKLLTEQISRTPSAAAKLNTIGLRDREYTTPKHKNSKRILILGDSFTFGSGVADDSAIFPERLEQQLNADLADKETTVEILNGGLMGSLTGDWVELLSRVKDNFQPNVILVVFFLRDGTRTTAMGSFFEPIRKKIVKQNQTAFAYRHSYAYRIIKDLRDRQYISKNYTKALTDSYFGDTEQTKEWAVAQRNLLQIKSISNQIHAKIGLVVFPVLVELNNQYPFSKICDLLSDFSKRNDIATLNLLPAFIGQNAPDLWVSAYDQHPNAFAHAIAATTIAPFLRQLMPPLIHTTCSASAAP